MRDLRGEASESSLSEDAGEETDEELQFDQNNIQGSKNTLSTSESQRRQGILVDTQDSDDDGHHTDNTEGRADPRSTLLSFGEGAGGHNHKKRREAVKIRKSNQSNSIIKDKVEKFENETPKSTLNSSKIHTRSTPKRQHPTL